MKIALVRSLDGHTTLCGPDAYADYSDDYEGPMDAALSWHLEAGHLPAECLWIEVELPPIPDLATIKAAVERGEFSRSFVEEMDQ